MHRKDALSLQDSAQTDLFQVTEGIDDTNNRRQISDNERYKQLQINTTEKSADWTISCLRIF